MLPTIGLAVAASQMIAALGCMTGMVTVHAS
jgi:hypothetical protein